MTPSTATDAYPSPLSPAQRLAQDAATAAELRASQTDPDVVALRVDRIRGQVEALMWTGIVLGLCFTMTTVQHFAATGSATGSLGWWAAWLLDPMVSLVLLAVLRAEQLTTRHHVATGPWPRIAKWVLLTATYVMNTWAFWATGSASGVVLHSVPPLVVVIAAEALTELQYALTTCAQRAAHHQGTPAEQAQPAPVSTSTPEHPTTTMFVNSHPEPTPTTGAPPLGGAHDHPRSPLPERPDTPAANTPAPRGDRAVTPGRGRRPSAAASGRRPSPGSRTPPRRTLAADYLAQARSAYQPGVVVSPAWVRQVTGCSRGLSTRLATTLRADVPTTVPTTPSTTQTEPERRAA